MSRPPARSDRLRILLAEDSLIVAQEMIHLLEELDCEVIGPFGRLDRLIEAADEIDFDCAILDVDLRGEEVFPAVDRIIGRNRPVILASGFSSLQIPMAYRSLPLLEKPLTSIQLQNALRKHAPDHTVNSS